ncbi:hypothetical protein QTP70_007168 [Hemibagrus guttatus]|uniref:Lebercilin domain-containing protein n=1 Tax=Hemibagrus guttatus TaxID=175788 RepID=A0AAE0QC24_9TELE|nr:hypothetical protein QTP70_007168 [Hemibagrus guttatus]
MEKDYRMASGKFWQTVRHLRRGKQLSANTVYSGGGELLASTGDVVGRWKEYFEDLLNPTDTPSIEEPEAKDSEVDSFITQAEVTEVVQQLLGGKAPGVDEIRPEYLKSLDVVGLSWLTRLCNIAWRSGTVPLDWATGVVVPLFKKGDRREEQCGFRPSRGTLDQLYTLHRVLEGLWEFAQPVHMCFVDLEKAFDRVPRGILWEVLWEYGVHGPLLRAVRSLYNRSKSLVLIASSWIYRMHGVHFAAECEAAGMRVSTSKSEAMVLDRKKVACTLQVGGEVLPQVEEFKYLRDLFTSEGRMDCEIDRRIGAAAAVMRSMYRSVVVKKELSRKAKLSIYQSIYVPTLTYGHELWVINRRVRSRLQAAEMSFLRRVEGRSLRDRVRSSVTWEELGVEPLLLHIERGQLRWLGHLFRMPPGRLPGEVFRACPTGKRPRGRPRIRWRDYVFRLAWERLGIPPEELEEVSGEREIRITDKSQRSFSPHPPPTPRKGARTQRVSNVSVHPTGVHKGVPQRPGPQTLPPLSWSSGVHSQKLSKDAPPQNLSLVTKRLLSACLLKISQLKNALAEQQLRTDKLQRENRLLKQFQLRQEKSLQRYGNTESEISELIARHDNEMHVLRERLQRSLKKERMAERRCAEAEVQLQQCQNQLHKLQQLTDEKRLGEKGELARKLSHAQAKVQESERKVKELEKNMELSTGSFQRQLASERKCLRNSIPRPCLTTSVENPNAATQVGASPARILWYYRDLHEVFSRERAASLPCHRSWDCAIDLFPNTTPPKN